MTKAMDLIGLSYKKFNTFKKVTELSQIPDRIVKTNRDKLDSKFEFKKNNYGYYMNPKEKIEFVLQQTIRMLIAQSDAELNDEIVIKLCADGTQLTKTHLSVVNLAFSIISPLTKNVMSPFGTFILGK